jgi:cell wall-associated NlpC family hydrolase
VRNNFQVTNVYESNKTNSKISTQLLYGDQFKKLKKIGQKIKIKNELDNYKGYIKNKNFLNNQKNTHKVYTLFSHVYLKPNNKSKTKKKLSFGSKIKVLHEKNNFYKFDNYWIKKSNLKKIGFKTKDLFADVKKFVNVKYKWGGKYHRGVDCSALVQLLLNYNNKFCPRDAKDQIKYFKKKITFKKIKKNDLIFWEGHVAIVLSKKKLIHAYGPFKKVVIMSIDKTINRIYRTAKLKVIGIRRV